uniref:Uncharacterized protein n=1 Tax=Tanacetum cinerariifolium TaxID=118510 RepID=A0A699HYY1_TANCI|nr:hypothetical protein [Tanacetum cinerariifolium]
MLESGNGGVSMVVRDGENGGNMVKDVVVPGGSVVERMKNRRCRTRGSAKAHVKRKLATSGSPLRIVHQKSSNAKVKASSFLAISDEDDKGFPKAFELNTIVDLELLDLHDRLYTRQDVVNRRARELLEVVKEMKGECEVIKERENARDKESLEEDSKIKEPFDLSKVKGYHQSYKKQYTQVKNDFAIIVFLILSEATVDPLAPIKTLISKKPSTLRHPTPSKTSAPTFYVVPSKDSTPPQQVTPSPAPSTKPVSPLHDA